MKGEKTKRRKVKGEKTKRRKGEKAKGEKAKRRKDEKEKRRKDKRDVPLKSYEQPDFSVSHVTSSRRIGIALSNCICILLMLCTGEIMPALLSNSTLPSQVERGAED